MVQYSYSQSKTTPRWLGNRPCSGIARSLGIALALASEFLAGTISAQVPGICTQPDGASWAMSRDPYAGTRPITTMATPSGSNNAAASDAVRAYLLGRTCVGQSQLASQPVSHQNAGTIPLIPNRYAPHSVRPKQPETPVGAVPLPAISASDFNRGINPYSHASNRSFRPNGGDDDLLAPTPANGDDLLGRTTAQPSADPLASMGPDANQERERDQKKVQTPGNDQAAIDPHWEVFANNQYPSALQCAKCHQKIYDEWRVSSHAYAAVSPMFQRFEQTVSELTRGTSGTFCVRCHAPVATQHNYPREAPIFEGAAVFREGITCIACHRVVERYGRVNGERRIETGNAFDAVTGTLGGDGVAAVIANADHFKVKTDRNDQRPLQGIHRGAIQFEQLTDSSFCAGCHQVLVQPGIALEVVYQQYRSGPACKKGVSCQDCHMGAVPGKPDGYTYGPAAEISGKTINNNRKHANHMFHGPAYPLAHPGIFPHNEKSLRWTAEQWLQFDHRQGWGTDEFEKWLAQGGVQMQFPKPWDSAQERRDARKVVDENQKLIAVKRSYSVQTLENGSSIEGPFFDETPRAGQDLKFRFHVKNISEGHNMPSGSLGAQPQLWLNAVLIGPDGSHLWESGHLDTNGDLCDWHSLDVRANRFQRDRQLFNMQTKFLITNVKGTEREMYLPINFDIDPLPFFRPGTVPYTVLNHPPLIRMEAHSVPPLDSRTAHYAVPGELLRMPGVYRISVRMRSRVEPAYFLLFCKGTPDMLQSLNESIIDVHPYSTEFLVR